MRLPCSVLACACAALFAFTLPAHAAPITIDYTAENATETYTGSFTLNGTKLFNDILSLEPAKLKIRSFTEYLDGILLYSGKADKGSVLDLFANDSFDVTLLGGTESLFFPEKDNINGRAIVCFIAGCTFHDKVDGKPGTYSFQTDLDTSTVVPEPSSLLLLATGALCLVTTVRRRLA
jgi:hypothetical protein